MSKKRNKERNTHTWIFLLSTKYAPTSQLIHKWYLVYTCRANAQSVVYDVHRCLSSVSMALQSIHEYLMGGVCVRPPPPLSSLLLLLPSSWKFHWIWFCFPFLAYISHLVPLAASKLAFDLGRNNSIQLSSSFFFYFRPKHCLSLFVISDKRFLHALTLSLFRIYSHWIANQMCIFNQSQWFDNSVVEWIIGFIFIAFNCQTISTNNAKHTHFFIICSTLYTFHYISWNFDKYIDFVLIGSFSFFKFKTAPYVRLFFFLSHVASYHISF